MGYWDTSALVKLYAKEHDSMQFEELALKSASAPKTSALAVYEIQTTLRRKEAEGTLSPGAAETNIDRLMHDISAGQIVVVDFSPSVEREFYAVLKRCFHATPPRMIRTLDAIHLASAIVSGESEFFVTDKRLREAAQFFDFKVAPQEMS